MTNKSPTVDNPGFENFLPGTDDETQLRFERFAEGKEKNKIVFFVIDKSKKDSAVEASIRRDSGQPASGEAAPFKSAKTSFSSTGDGLPKPKLQRVLTFIAENIGEEITLDKMAKISRMSVYYFARMFKQAVGISPYQFVLEQRLDYGKYLLTETNLPLVEISLRCGCSNQSHFTTVFKQFLGITPKRYRDCY